MKVIVEKCHFDIERLQREVNILFVSDLHYDIIKHYKDPLLSGAEINTLLVKSIEIGGKDWQPDVVIVGGDLINNGDQKNYPHYFDLIQKLVKKFPNLKHSVYSTPGNHDVTRRKKKSLAELNSYLSILRGKSGKKKNPPDKETPFDKFFALSKKDIVNDKSLLDTLVKFEKLHFPIYLKMRSKVHHEYLSPLVVRYPVEGIKTVYFTPILGINIVCHNSSFFCSLGGTGDDRNNLFLINDLVFQMNKVLPKTGPIISFMHHPYHFLNESEYNAPLQNERDIRYNIFSTILEKSDIILSGHLHGDLQDPTYEQQHAYLITNGTSYTPQFFEGKCYPYTYALIKVNKQSNWFAMKKFVYSHSKNENKRHYRLIPGERPHYEFSPRDHYMDTSLEAEKVRVLEYFSNVSKEASRIKEYKFFTYQLGLYQDEFRFERRRIFTFVPGTAGGVRTLCIQPTKQKRQTFIYYVNANNYIEVIIALLGKRAKHNIPASTLIYFSINRSLLLIDRELHTEKIDALIHDYRAQILLAKTENVSINLLYH